MMLYVGYRLISVIWESTIRTLQNGFGNNINLALCVPRTLVISLILPRCIVVNKPT